MNLLLTAAGFLVGLAFGSFLNVCISRLPRGRSVVTPGSACPSCGQPIAPYDNIPVVSWLLLGGRCRRCREPITVRYAVVELLTAILFAACVWRFGITAEGFKYGIFGFLLLGLIFTDAETKLLPNALTFPGIALGLGFSLMVPVNDVVTQWFSGSASHSWRLYSFLDSVVGAAVGAAFLYGVAAVYLRVRGVEGMGLGDVKLVAMIGAWLGLKLMVLTVFAASVTGALFGIATIFVIWWKRARRLQLRMGGGEKARRRAWQSARLAYRYFEMPFGVFLGGMGFAALAFGNQILQWYWRRL